MPSCLGATSAKRNRLFVVLIPLLAACGSDPAPDPSGRPVYLVAQVGPNEGESIANDISNSGIVIGDSRSREAQTSSRTAFVWQTGQTLDLAGRAVRAINDAGDLVGDSGGFAYVWRNDEAGAPLAHGSAHGINNDGWVVGEASTSNGHLRAFLWDGESTFDLGTLGGDWSGAYRISDSGRVVGWAETAGGDVHAFSWAGGAMSDLGTLGGRRSMAYSVNELGLIVGYAATATGEDHAFVAAEGGRMVDLGTLGTYSVAYDVDNSGRVVGESGTERGETHAFLWRDGRMTDLNDLVSPDSGWILTRALAINEAGQIVGQGLFWGEKRAFSLNME